MIIKVKNKFFNQIGKNPTFGKIIENEIKNLLDKKEEANEAGLLALDRKLDEEARRFKN